MNDSFKIVMFVAIGVVIGLLIGSTVAVTGNTILDRITDSLDGSGTDTYDSTGDDKVITFADGHTQSLTPFERDSVMETGVYNTFEEYVNANIGDMNLADTKRIIQVQAAMLDKLAFELKMTQEWIKAEGNDFTPYETWKVEEGESIWIDIDR